MEKANWADGKPLRVPLRVQLKEGASWGELQVVEEIETASQIS